MTQLPTRSFVAKLKGDKSPYGFQRLAWNVAKAAWEPFGPAEGFAREVENRTGLDGRTVIIHQVDGINYFQALP
jgi:hypothetical protein